MGPIEQFASRQALARAGKPKKPGSRTVFPLQQRTNSIPTGQSFPLDGMGHKWGHLPGDPSRRAYQALATDTYGTDYNPLYTKNAAVPDGLSRKQYFNRLGKIAARNKANNASEPKAPSVGTPEFGNPGFGGSLSFPEYNQIYRQQTNQINETMGQRQQQGLDALQSSQDNTRGLYGAAINDVKNARDIGYDRIDRENLAQKSAVTADLLNRGLGNSTIDIAHNHEINHQSELGKQNLDFEQANRLASLRQNLAASEGTYGQNVSHYWLAPTLERALAPASASLPYTSPKKPSILGSLLGLGTGGLVGGATGGAGTALGQGIGSKLSAFFGL